MGGRKSVNLAGKNEAVHAGREVLERFRSAANDQCQGAFGLYEAVRRSSSGRAATWSIDVTILAPFYAQYLYR